MDRKNHISWFRSDVPFCSDLRISMQKFFRDVAFMPVIINDQYALMRYRTEKLGIISLSGENKYTVFVPSQTERESPWSEWVNKIRKKFEDNIYNADSGIVSSSFLPSDTFSGDAYFRAVAFDPSFAIIPLTKKRSLTSSFDFQNGFFGIRAFLLSSDIKKTFELYQQIVEPIFSDNTTPLEFSFEEYTGNERDQFQLLSFFLLQQQAFVSHKKKMQLEGISPNKHLDMRVIQKAEKILKLFR